MFNIAVSGYIGKKKTGIGRVLENILLNMAILDKSIKYYLFINYDQDSLLNVKWPSNIIIIKYNVSKNHPIFNILWHQYSYQRLVKKYNCQLSVIPNFSLLLWKNTYTISIIHDLIEYNVKSKFSKIRMIYRRFAVPLMAKNSDKIITVSCSSKNDIIKFLKVPDSKIKVIYNGYDNNHFLIYPVESTEKVLEKYNIVYKSYILYVGTIDHPGKNLYSVLLSYFKLKKEKSIKEKLIIIGQEGFNVKILYDLVEKSSYKSDVKFIGYIEDNELPYFFNGAKLFCFLSLYEGFGLPVLEAMACGCPVITSNNSALSEIAGTSALCVDPLNIDLITKKLYELLTNDSLRENMITKGLKKSKTFSWLDSATKYLNVFNDIT